MKSVSCDILREMQCQKVIFVLTAIVFVQGVFSATLFSTGVGDESVIVNNGGVRCGKLACPTQAAGCIYQKKTNPSNSKLVDITRRCIDRNGSTVAEDNEQVDSDGQYFNTYVNTGSGGYNNVIIKENLDPQQAAHIEKQVNDLTSGINQEINDSLSKSMRNLQKNLQTLGDIFRSSYW